jgi:glucose-1-phosphate cytidylyltransferase
VRPPGRFGVFNLTEDSNLISNFTEKPEGGESPWINGGFFVLEPQVLDYIDTDETVWEKDPLEQLAADNQLVAYRHTGFWQPMDTLRDRNVLEEMWMAEKAKWKVWSEPNDMNQSPTAYKEEPEVTQPSLLN